MLWQYRGGQRYCIQEERCHVESCGNGQSKFDRKITMEANILNHCVNYYLKLRMYIHKTTGSKRKGKCVVTVS